MSGYFPFSLSNGLSGPPILTPPNKQDLLDYTGSGNVQSERYINPLTMDFVVGPNGQFLGQNATDQSVMLALSTTFNSSSVPGLGNNFGSIKTIGSNIIQQMTNALNVALGSLIANGFIVLGNVNIQQTGQNQISVSFTYYNQSINDNITASFSLQNGVMGIQ